MARKLDNNEEGVKITLTKQRVKKASRIFKFLKPYRFTFAIGVVMLLLTSATALVFPWLMGNLIDVTNAKEAEALSKEQILENVNRLGLILLVVFSLQGIFSFFRIKLFVSVTERMLNNLRQESYAKLISLPMGFFSSRRVGELQSRLSSDITQLQDTFTTTVAEFLRQFILIIGGVAMLSLTSIRLSLLMLAIIPILALVATFFGRFVRKISKKIQDSVAESNTIVEETLQGIASVKAFANEAFEIMRYKRSTNEVLKLALKNGNYRGGFAAFIIMGVFGGIIFIVWYASHMLANGELTNGQLIQFIIYTMFVGASIGGIAEMYAQIQKSVGATERIMDILDEISEPIDLNYAKSEDKVHLNGNIALNDVGFTYPSRPDVVVLKSISFTASKGERIAIVGPSGAGKSTIIQLLQRFYDPNKGQVMFDGKDARDYALTALRSNIGIVPQDVILFGGTIRENISYGKPGATEEEIVDAAKKANAYDFIMSFPEQFETIVGDRGIQLSGGQRQRIAIARAVLKNPAILLLDEATSSLDSESEKLVQEALETLMENRTSVIIAHRLSTIRTADRILVVDKGYIVESGTHAELIKNLKGIYFNLSKLQFELNEQDKTYINNEIAQQTE